MRGDSVSTSLTDQVIYLDNNATTPPLPEVIAAVAEAMSLGPTNPSSLHGAGRHARNVLAQARAQTAAMVGADESDVIFRSGATEANNIVLRSLLDLLAGHKRKT